MSDDPEKSPPDDVTLYRMVWHPDCYDNETLTSSGAFPSRDLDGTRFVSVDRDDLFNKAVAIELAKGQQEKANGETILREEARFINLPCRHVRSVTEENTQPFSVTSEPEETNPAHCGIWNISGKKGKGYINKIRAKLMELRTGEWTLSFEDHG